MMKFTKKMWLITSVCLIVSMLMGTVCFAGTFQKVFDQRIGTYDLAQDEAVSETVQTNDGELTFQFRKLKNEGNDKKFHLIVWLKKNKEKKRVYEKHLPQVMGGYSLRLFKDTSTSKIFLGVSSQNRAILSGYGTASGKYEIYADSMTYYNDFPAEPVFTVLTNGDLVLAFQSLYHAYFHSYRFVWDPYRQWFSYSDDGITYAHITNVSQPTRPIW